MAKHQHARNQGKSPPGKALWSYSWPKDQVVGLLAVALGILLYANTTSHQYVLDDFAAIQNNGIVKRGLNAENIGLLFTTEYRHGSGSTTGSLYRPIPLLMFAAEWQLSPDDPRVGHWVSVLLYALTGWLLWATLRHVLAKQPPAMVVATVLLFMAHPVHTEVVANIKSRDEILALLFSLGTLYAAWRYVDKGGPHWLMASVLCYALALFSKESAITWLAVVPLTLWFFHNAPLRRTIHLSLSLLLPAVAYLLVRRSVVDPQAHLTAYSALDVVYFATDDRMEQLATALMMCGHHLWTLVFPHPLVSDMGYPQVRPVGFSDWRALVSLGVYAGLFVHAMAGLRRKWFSSYAILLYLITFSVASNVLVFVSTYAERMLYMPSLGFVLLLAHGIAKLCRIDHMHSAWDHNGRGKLFWGLTVTILALYCTRTVTRNPDWRNGLNLYTADLRISPNSALLNHNYGNEVIELGADLSTDEVTDTAQVMRAIAAQTRAIDLHPRFPNALNERGYCLRLLARYDEAEKDLRTTLLYQPDHVNALFNLAVVQLRTDRSTEAAESFRSVLHYAPHHIAAYQNLGLSLAMTGRFPEAIEQWKEGLKHDPGNGTLYLSIGLVHREMGREDLARPWLERAKERGVGHGSGP